MPHNPYPVPSNVRIQLPERVFHTLAWLEEVVKIISSSLEKHAHRTPDRCPWRFMHFSIITCSFPERTLDVSICAFTRSILYTCSELDEVPIRTLASAAAAAVYDLSQHTERTLVLILSGNNARNSSSAVTSVLTAVSSLPFSRTRFFLRFSLRSSSFCVLERKISTNLSGPWQKSKQVPCCSLILLSFATTALPTLTNSRPLTRCLLCL
mmetsp:Transcript_46970/g.75489  ORF Transcript_46970/g.75489 Transcript_46970/m.75489 type:complete len:210 (+) Transcript_46970:1852-2481(+)